MNSNHDQDHDHDDTAAAALLVAGVGLALLVTLATAIGLLVQAGGLGPHLGDIVSFKAGQSIAPDLGNPVQARRARLVNATDSQGTCRLDPGVIAVAGGSLIVEARRPGPDGDFLVHWAGPRTARVDDCGRSAELTLSPDKLTSLAAAAGGFGVGQKTLAAAPPMGVAGMTVGMD